MARRINIVIAEPSAVIRSGVSTILQSAQDFSVEVVEVSDVASLSSLSFRHTPDVLIINPIYVGVMLPVQFKDDLKSENLKVIALLISYVDGSLVSNYDDSFSINDSAEKILKSVFSVVSQDDDTEERRELSSREKEIIVCVVKGMTNKQIADALYLSAHTVIAHRRNIANKLQIHSPSGLTIYAIVNKLVDLSEIKSSISQNI